MDTSAGPVEATSTTSRWTFGPGQIVGGSVGVAACAFGVLAVTRAGIDATLNAPVVSVLGFSQSAAVGLAELVLGLLLLAGAASVWNRALMGFVGGVMFVAGLVVAASSAALLHDVGADHRTGWLVLVGGIVAIVAAAMPVFSATRSDRRVV